VTQNNKYDQELACAQAFINWLSSSSGIAYKLKRAKTIGGRWDFVAQRSDSQEWLGIEIKSLVISADHRQLNDWNSFLTHVSKQLTGRVAGSYLVIAGMPWKFRQQEEKESVEPFIQALADLDRVLSEGEGENLGPGMNARFPKWPTKPPSLDVDVMGPKFIYPPEDLHVDKIKGDGATVELGGSVGQPVDNVDWMVFQALRDIFEPDKKGVVKPSVQLTEAKEQGASRTILLLDSHIVWRPGVVKRVLAQLDAALMSGIDAIYFVDSGGGKVRLVWHNNG
jgi:hypothetical protein